MWEITVFRESHRYSREWLQLKWTVDETWIQVPLNGNVHAMRSVGRFILSVFGLRDLDKLYPEG